MNTMKVLLVLRKKWMRLFPIEKEGVRFARVKHIPGLWKRRLVVTPSYKQLIQGSERPFLGTYFFFCFSLRLSENHLSQVISIANLAPQLLFGVILSIFTMYFQSNQRCLLMRDTFLSWNDSFNWKYMVNMAKITPNGSCRAKVRKGNDLGMLVLS